ncbi:MAG TPA: hypothetical protein VFR09_08575, partial [Alphaproteobacteria bacterium]|nr:hypothetical protein [Alphaproteobacteria bacterium]
HFPANYIFNTSEQAETRLKDDLAKRYGGPQPIDEKIQAVQDRRCGKFLKVVYVTPVTAAPILN